MLIGQEDMDLRILSKLAMARDQDDLYDPIVLTNDRGELTGTITMQQLLLRAFDTEIRLAASANPLTGLPGNMIIGDWLSRAVVQKVYTVVYFDLDKFKEYNDCYGYAAGDDFIAVADVKLGESEIEAICRRFDDEKLGLFSSIDIDRGYYMSVNRIGATVKSPLVTLSAAIITSDNYTTPPHPGQIGQTVAILKKEIKKRNAEILRSGCILDQRRYDFSNSNNPCL
jgi:GGDEF domain-containing protein